MCFVVMWLGVIEGDVFVCVGEELGVEEMLMMGGERGRCGVFLTGGGRGCSRFGLALSCFG